MSDSQTTTLPTSWTLAPLSDIAEINPKLDKADVADSLEVSFVPMPAVQATTGEINVTETRQFGQVKKGYTAFREGDVLFAKITPCMENGKMAIVPKVRNGLAFGSTEFHVLRARSGINAHYIYHFVSSQRFRYDAEHNMTGAVGQRRVPTAYLTDHPIPIPPSCAQNRIVAKIEELLSELCNGIESLETALDQLKVYRQAVLKHAFEGKLTAAWREDRSNSGDLRWSSAALGDLLDLVTSGSRGWAKYYSSKGNVFIRAQNLKNDRLELDDIAFVQIPENSEGTRTRVQVGDILITITGANVTKTGIVKEGIGPAYVSQHVALARPTEVLVSEFLYWFLVAEAAGRKQLNAAAYGAGKPGLNLDNIRSVVIPLPTKLEQTEIVNRINSILSVVQNCEAAIDAELKRSDALRQSILDKAFSGELVEDHPDDEPACALLQGLKVAKTISGKDGKKNNRRNAA